MERVSLRIVGVLFLLLIFPSSLAFAIFQEGATDGQSREVDPGMEPQSDFVAPKLNKRVEADLPHGVRYPRTRMTVILEITVDESGTTTYVRTLTGNRSLRVAATKAVRQWKFEPAKSNGVPVKAVGLITFCFSRDSKLSTSTYTFSFQQCCPESAKRAKPPCPNQDL